jgi:hypothetical protein
MGGPLRSAAGLWRRWSIDGIRAASGRYARNKPCAVGAVDIRLISQPQVAASLETVAVERRAKSRHLGLRMLSEASK